jgi:rod shape-determining protein MreC
MFPILMAQNKIVMPIKDYFEEKKSIQELQAVIAKLQKERDEVVALNIQLQALFNYIEDTKELTLFKKQFDTGDAILAQVLVKHFSDQSHYFLIDKGSESGIQQDMVALYKNCLLGKVIEVYPLYSKVLLITDALCKVAAFCPQTQSSGIHEGSNQEGVTGLRYVSHLAEIEPNDLVLSSGDGLIFPKGFALGKIKSCKPDGLFYDVSVELLIDMRKISYCYIVQKGHEQQLQKDADFMQAVNTSAHPQTPRRCNYSMLLSYTLKTEQLAMMQVEDIDVNFKRKKFERIPLLPQ